MGPDKVHPRTPKESADISADPYSRFIQRCMDDGKFPSRCKAAALFHNYTEYGYNVTPVIQKCLQQFTRDASTG
ncbi:unnamed protein product [Echinostoma caproni]|uniref:DNA-binding protein RFX7 n=1 Tax=Echinostoma caproni TaxID=27848 RepID=A0A183BFC4_9TREM|nr:unnamed protein product [Echinostoma caproni]